MASNLEAMAHCQTFLALKGLLNVAQAHGVVACARTFDDLGKFENSATGCFYTNSI